MDVSFGIETPAHLRILVEPFGTIPPSVFRMYLSVIVREFSCIPMYSLTRFKRDNENSPFVGMDWKSGRIRVQYVTSYPKYEYPIHEHDRVHGYIGIMSCRNEIKTIYRSFSSRFESLTGPVPEHSSLLIRRLFAVEYDPESRPIHSEDETEINSLKDLIIILPTEDVTKLRFYVERAVSDLFDALMKKIERSVIVKRPQVRVRVRPTTVRASKLRELKKFVDYALLVGDLADAEEYAKKILTLITVPQGKGHRRSVSVADLRLADPSGVSGVSGANVLIIEDDQRGGRARGGSGSVKTERRLSNVWLYGCCQEILACCWWLSSKADLTEDVAVPYRGPPLSATICRHRPMAFPLEDSPNIVIRPSFPPGHLVKHFDREVIRTVESHYENVFQFYEAAVGGNDQYSDDFGAAGSRASVVSRRRTAATSVLFAGLAPRKKMTVYPTLFRMYLQLAAFLGSLRTEVLREITESQEVDESREWCKHLRERATSLVTRTVRFASEFDLKGPQKLAIFEACTLVLCEIEQVRRRALLQLMIAREHHRKGADFLATMVGMLSFDSYKIPIRVVPSGEWEVHRTHAGQGWRSLQLPVLRLVVLYAKNDPLARIRLMYFMLTEYHDLMTKADQNALFYQLDQYSAQIRRELFSSSLSVSEERPLVTCLSTFPIFHSYLPASLSPDDAPDKEVIEEAHSVFLFVPDSFKTKKGDPELVRWVEGEVNQVNLTLMNPFLVDLVIRRVELQTNLPCRVYSCEVVLPAKTYLEIPIRVLPLEAGKLCFLSATVWINDVEGGLRLPLPPYKDLVLEVVEKLPLLMARLSVPSLTVHEGEIVTNSIRIDNLSEERPADLQSVEVHAQPKPGRSPAVRKFMRRDPSEVPDLTPESAIQLIPDFPNHLDSGETALIRFKIVVPPGLFRRRVFDFVIKYAHDPWERKKTVSLEIRCLRSLSITHLRGSMLRMTNSSAAGVVALLKGGNSVAVPPQHSKLLLDGELLGWRSEDNLEVRCIEDEQGSEKILFRLECSDGPHKVLEFVTVTAIREMIMEQPLTLKFVYDRAVCHFSGKLTTVDFARAGAGVCVVKFRFFKPGSYVLVAQLVNPSDQSVVVQKKVVVVIEE